MDFSEILLSSNLRTILDALNNSLSQPIDPAKLNSVLDRLPVSYSLQFPSYLSIMSEALDSRSLENAKVLLQHPTFQPYPDLNYYLGFSETAFKLLLDSHKFQANSETLQRLIYAGSPQKLLMYVNSEKFVPVPEEDAAILIMRHQGERVVHPLMQSSKISKKYVPKELIQQWIQSRLQ